MREVRLTKWEEEMIKLLKPRPLSSTEIIEAIYGKKRVPLNARQIVNGKLERLSRKLELAESINKIVKSERRGPHPITYQLKRSKHRVQASP